MLADTFSWLEDPSTAYGWYLPPQKILLAENRFLQPGKGDESTKEKSWQCFRVMFKHVASPNRRKKEIFHHILL
jgi:hypothetical protein